jgi:hypothetical protein
MAVLQIKPANTPPGQVITITAALSCKFDASLLHVDASSYQVVGNPVFAGKTFFVGSGKWQPIMAGARVQVVERGFGLVIVSEGTATNDGRMLCRGMLRKPIGW